MFSLINACPDCDGRSVGSPIDCNYCGNAGDISEDEAMHEAAWLEAKRRDEEESARIHALWLASTVVCPECGGSGEAGFCLECGLCSGHGRVRVESARQHVEAA